MSKRTGLIAVSCLALAAIIIALGLGLRQQEQFTANEADGAASGDARASEVPSPTSAPPSPVEPFTAPARVLLSGDSITEGWHATTEARSYRALTAAWLEGAGSEAVETTARAGYTIEEVAGGFPIPGDLDLAVVELGTNDAGRGLPVSTSQAQYRDYLAAIMKGSPDVRIICLGVWFPPAEQATAAFDTAIRQECEAVGGSFVPLARLFGQAGSRGPADVDTWVGPSDVFHPNDAGHRALADTVRAVIEAG